MYPKSRSPKAKPRSHGPFIIVKKLDKDTVIVRLQDDSEEIVNLDRCHTFKGQPMIEWAKDFVQSEKKDMGKSTSLVPATRTQATDEESQVSQIGSVVEEPQVVKIEEESEISLFPDTVTQDTEMSEPPKIRRGSRKPPGTYSQEQSFPVEGWLGTYLAKTAPENPPIPLNSLFPEDSASTDSDQDPAEDLDEFFCFTI